MKKSDYLKREKRRLPKALIEYIESLSDEQFEMIERQFLKKDVHMKKQEALIKNIRKMLTLPGGEIVFFNSDGEFLFTSAKVIFSEDKKPIQPPVNAELFLHLFLRSDEQDAVIGDLLERYPKKIERLGVRRANLWYCAQVIRSLWPLIKRALKTSGLLALGEWIRWHIS